jgi:Spy/CpxP family protein refolding chaperone
MTKLVIILGFLVSFAAGLVIGSSGMLVGSAPASPATSDSPSLPGATTRGSASPQHGEQRRSRSGYLTAELGLTTDQRAQLDRIWSAVAKANDQDDRRRGYRRERDEAIAQLVPPGRLGDYDQIIDTYHDRIDALEQMSRDAYATAVDETKQILTPEQRTRYEELLKRHKWGPGARDPRHTGRRSETRATSQPTDAADEIPAATSSSSPTNSDTSHTG